MVAFHHRTCHRAWRASSVPSLGCCLLFLVAAELGRSFRMVSHVPSFFSGRSWPKGLRPGTPSRFPWTPLTSACRRGLPPPVYWPDLFFPHWGKRLHSWPVAGPPEKARDSSQRSQVLFFGTLCEAVRRAPSWRASHLPPHPGSRLRGLACRSSFSARARSRRHSSHSGWTASLWRQAAPPLRGCDSLRSRLSASASEAARAGPAVLGFSERWPPPPSRCGFQCRLSGCHHDLRTALLARRWTLLSMF